MLASLIIVFFFVGVQIAIFFISVKVYFYYFWHLSFQLNQSLFILLTFISLHFRQIIRYYSFQTVINWSFEKTYLLFWWMTVELSMIIFYKFNLCLKIDLYWLIWCYFWLYLRIYFRFNLIYSFCAYYPWRLQRLHFFIF